MAVFEAYFDESGTHAGSTTVVVGGAMAEQSEWHSLMTDWTAKLSCYGIPIFHASELAALKGPYKGWSEHQRKQLLAGLLDILEAHDIFYIAVGVNYRLYTEILKDYSSITLDPYNFCCMYVIGEVIMQSTPDKTGPVAITFESGQKFESSPNTIGLRNELKLPNVKEYYNLAHFGVGDKRVFRQLEVADCVAYEVYRHESNHAMNTADLRDFRLFVC